MGTSCDGTHRLLRPRKLPSTVWVMILSALPVTGCTMAKASTEALSRAELNLRTATEARADELAPMDLQRAREKLDGSKKAIAAGQYEEARRLAEIAQVEAELAEAKAEAEITRRAADALRQSVDALRQEIERSAGRGSSARSKE
jgi:biopolymer transport protein ExbB/TolQ